LLSLILPDDVVLATAVSAHADYLVTGDTGLLHVGNYEGVQILSPRAFLDLLCDEPSLLGCARPGH
jgi:predicted nucleic acid-binding protein